jgi:hypothetical protein
MKITNNINYWSLLGFVILAIGLFKSDSVMVGAAVIIFVVLSCTIDILKAIDSKTNQDSN